ncbi:transposase [Dictyobacter kobayashii]|uniref:Transposase IS4-like domain-containing protein n=1 Tax=Dictyobacter kobayashii TaxID=2014872 RepID=A0A402APT1_9CHLR|nr:transposase [Dictyobacter kobayashii]GCE21064.1 hypothetical protein KDK_48640 [Dictyobacter kobayashii]
MSYPETVWHWIKEVARRFPHLSWPQAKVLACYSLGIVIAGTCGLTQVSDSLAEVLGQTQPTVFQRLREWRNEAGAKRGSHRQQVDVSACFAPLLTWILSCWDPSSHRLVLVVDATNVSDRFVILSISVVLRSCAIPVAWHIVPAGVKGEHKSHWLHLLESLRGSVPAQWEVLVMADRGLYARWLYQKIVACGWHPFLRIRSGSKARPASSHRVGDFREIKTLVPSAGTQWSGDVMCFSDRHARLRCRLLARWDEGYEEPWFVVTDLPVEEAQACWYGLRPWIECGFKDGKRGGGTGNAVGVRSLHGWNGSGWPWR